MTSEAVPFPPRPPEIPTEIVLVVGELTIRLSPNEMKAVREAAGKSLGDLEEEENTQLSVYSKLRRDGFDITWEQAGDVVVSHKPPDPTSGEPSTSSPDSADSGP